MEIQTGHIVQHESSYDEQTNWVPIHFFDVRCPAVFKILQIEFGDLNFVGVLLMTTTPTASLVQFPNRLCKMLLPTVYTVCL